MASYSYVIWDAGGRTEVPKMVQGSGRLGDRRKYGSLELTSDPGQIARKRADWCLNQPVVAENAA
jgi:hypothetical protein